MLDSNIVRRLGEAGCTREDGRVGLMDLLARAGLPVPEGFVITREAHLEFLVLAGLADSPLSSVGLCSDGGECIFPPEEEAQPALAGEALTRMIRDAVLDLGAKTVSVFDGAESHSGLGSIPEVLLAVRRAWMPIQSLTRQRAADYPDHEPPTWPVLVQREIPPEYTEWSATEHPSAILDHPPRNTYLDGITLHNVGPSGAGRVPHPSIARLTRQAGFAAGEPVRVEWGLHEGRWHVLSVSRESERQDR